MSNLCQSHTVNVAVRDLLNRLTTSIYRVFGTSHKGAMTSHIKMMITVRASIRCSCLNDIANETARIYSDRDEWMEPIHTKPGHSVIKPTGGGASLAGKCAPSLRYRG